MDWEAVSAIAAAVAAIAAAAAVFQTVKQLRDQRRFWVLERRSAGYQAVVANPVGAAVDDFVREARELLRTGQTQIREASSREQVDRGRASLTSDFNSCYFRYKGRVRRARRTWRDESLSQTLKACVEQIQDDVTLAVENLPQEDAPDFDLLLNDHGSAVMRLVMEADPGIHWEETESGLWRFLGRGSPNLLGLP